MSATVGKPIVVAGSNNAEARRNVEALRTLGVPAEDIRLLLPTDAAEARETVLGARGLLVGGGNDLEPHHYSEDLMPDSRVKTEPERDRLDLESLAGARDARVPTWCICRGLQSLNVFLGGTLWQDIPTQRGGPPVHEVEHPLDALAHEVLVEEPDTATGRILGREPAWVNSRHHQAIKDLATGLVGVARSPDGLIEAVEGSASGPAGDWWVRAVQWHPEDLLALPQQRTLWDEFLKAADDSGESP
ncbi:MAG: gamma-glutamyl-gamma-aminobutyrate hydrolase family protein [Acidobacteriota bacterium]